MTLAVQSCIKCKFTDCVDVRPLDCVFLGPKCLATDPERCSDCTLCADECPVNPVSAEDDEPAGLETDLALDAAPALRWPVIDGGIPAPPDADDWYGVTDQRARLQR